MWFWERERTCETALSAMWFAMTFETRCSTSLVLSYITLTIYAFVLVTWQYQVEVGFPRLKSTGSLFKSANLLLTRGSPMIFHILIHYPPCSPCVSFLLCHRSLLALSSRISVLQDLVDRGKWFWILWRSIYAFIRNSLSSKFNISVSSACFASLFSYKVRGVFFFVFCYRFSFSSHEMKCFFRCLHNGKRGHFAEAFY